MDATGGAVGLRDLGALESALAQPKATFGGADLHEKRWSTKQERLIHDVAAGR
jgi:hypothetical protein